MALQTQLKVTHPGEPLPFLTIRDNLQTKLKSEITLLGAQVKKDLSPEKAEGEIASYDALLTKIESVTSKQGLFLAAQEAVRTKIPNAVQLFVESGFALTESHEENGNTLLHYASAYNNLEAAIYLVQLAIARSMPQFVNARDNDGITPLHWGMHYGHLAIVHLLTGVGEADTSVLDNKKFTVWDHAVSKGNLAALMQLFNIVTPSLFTLNQAILNAVSWNKIEIAVELINRGANVNMKVEGTSLLKVAFDQGNEELVYLLIDKGATFKHSEGDECSLEGLLRMNLKMSPRFTFDQMKVAGEIIDKIKEAIRNEKEYDDHINTLSQLHPPYADEMLYAAGIHEWRYKDKNGEEVSVSMMLLEEGEHAEIDHVRLPRLSDLMETT